MTPFNVRLKLEAWGVITYVEINLYSSQFRLLRDRRLSVNGVEKAVPYASPPSSEKSASRVQVFMSGQFLTFVADFGLEVIWEGTNHMEVRVCDSYAGHVCGMCGDGIGGCAILPSSKFETNRFRTYKQTKQKPKIKSYGRLTDGRSKQATNRGQRPRRNVEYMGRQMACAGRLVQC